MITEGALDLDSVSEASLRHKSRLNELSATEIAGRIAARDLTAEAVVGDCLARIAAREPEIHAFAHVES